MATNTIDLSGFHGSQTFYRQPLFPAFRFTEGVQHLAEQAKAYWLIDVIFSWQIEEKVKAEEFQVWKLTVEAEKGVVTCEDGNGNTVAVQSIPYTDFPLTEITIWFTDNTALLPSEY